MNGAGSGSPSGNPASSGGPAAGSDGNPVPKSGTSGSIDLPPENWSSLRESMIE